MNSKIYAIQRRISLLDKDSAYDGMYSREVKSGEWEDFEHASTLSTAVRIRESLWKDFSGSYPNLLFAFRVFNERTGKEVKAITAADRSRQRFNNLADDLDGRYLHFIYDQKMSHTEILNYMRDWFWHHERMSKLSSNYVSKLREREEVWLKVISTLYTEFCYRFPEGDVVAKEMTREQLHRASEMPAGTRWIKTHEVYSEFYRS